MSKSLNDHTLDVLDGFQRIALEDVPPDVLMKRIDRKFPFHVSDIGKVLDGLQENFLVLEAVGDIVSPYQTLYFDTDDFKFYYDHHRGLRNRMKIRYRSYPRTQTHFLEIKSKNNKSQTSKERIDVWSSEPGFSDEARKFLERNVDPELVGSLEPTIHIYYNRLAFIGRDFNERFSIDFDVHFEDQYSCGKFEGLAIAEIKQAEYRTTEVVQHFRTSGLRESSMSKYCLGMANLRPELKSGEFKAALRNIEKITRAA